MTSLCVECESYLLVILKTCDLQWFTKLDIFVSKFFLVEPPIPNQDPIRSTGPYNFDEVEMISVISFRGWFKLGFTFHGF